MAVHVLARAGEAGDVLGEGEFKIAPLERLLRAEGRNAQLGAGDGVARRNVLEVGLGAFYMGPAAHQQHVSHDGALVAGLQRGGNLGREVKVWYCRKCGHTWTEID